MQDELFERQDPLTPTKRSEPDSLVEPSSIKEKVCTANEAAERGRILAALRRSPLVGADLDLSRSRANMRRVDL